MDNSPPCTTARYLRRSHSRFTGPACPHALHRHTTAVAIALALALLCPPALPAENLLENGGFENGLTGWPFACLRSVPHNTYLCTKHASVAVDEAVASEGSRSVRIECAFAYDDTDPRAVLEHRLPALPAGHYRFTVRYRLEAAPAEGFGFIISDRAGASIQLKLPPHDQPTHHWRLAKGCFHNRAPATWRVLLYLKGKGRIWYDDAKLTAISTKEYMEAMKLPPRDYHIETVLVRSAQPQAVIISSRRPAYAHIARTVQRRIRDITGVSLPVVDAGTVTTHEVLAHTNAIALGNMVHSRFIETLYWQWYTLLDLWYPGQFGYVLRTLHDPYGTGRNVIFLGGSDDRAVRDAAAAFLDALEPAEPLKVGRLMDIKLGKGHQQPPITDWIDPRLRVFRDDVDIALGYTPASRAGLRYYYCADQDAGRLFRDRALNTPVILHSDHYTHHMFALVWDLIEESPIFSDEDRRKITAKLLQHARGPDGTAGRPTLLNYHKRPNLLDRHASMQAICTLIESRYFNKYWPDTEWEQNLHAVRKYFDRQMTTAKADSDLGGRGIYTYFECALVPSLLLSDRRFLNSGALRRFAELVLMHCDNTGYMPDTGQSSYTSYPTYSLNVAAALLNDGGFLATGERRREAERISRDNTISAGFTAGQAWARGHPRTHAEDGRRVPPAAHHLGA